MTYLGQPYYPAWLDNLADDVTLEGAAMEGRAPHADTRASLETGVSGSILYEF
jgi:hypothetical protein